MARTRLALLAHLLRGVILAVALLGALTLGAYRWRPQALAAVDAALDRWHLGPAEAELQAAAALALREPGAAMARLEQIAVQWDGQQPGDRLEALHTTASLLLAHAHLAADQPQPALDALAPVLARNPQHVTVRLTRVQALLRMGARRHDAVAELENLFAVLPEHSEIARRLLTAHTEVRDLAAAGRVLAGHLRAPRPWMFTLQYEAPEPADPALRRMQVQPMMAADGRFWLTCRLPPGSTALQLDLPVRDWDGLRDAALHAADGTLLAQADLSAPGPGLQFTAGRLGPSGQGVPAVHMALPAAVGRDGLVCTLSGRLTFRAPPELGPWLADPAAAAIVAQLTAAGRDADARLVRSRRSWQALGDGVMLYWRAGQQGYGGDRTAIARPEFGPPGDDGVAFEVEFTVEATCTALRFDPTELADIGFALTGVHLVGPSTQWELPPDAVARGGSARLLREGDGFRTAAADAWLEIPLAAPAHVQTVRIRGVCR